MPKVMPAKKPDNGNKITRDLRVASYPKELLVRLDNGGQPTVVVQLDPPGGDGMVLSIQGAAVLARELRTAVHAYLNPKPAAQSDSQETG